MKYHEKIYYSLYFNDNKIKIVEDLANLHFKNLYHSKYSLLGIDFVIIFYFSLLSSNNVNLYIAKNEQSKIVGFIIWADNKISINKLLLLNLFRHKYLRFNLIKKLFNINNLRNILIYIFKPKYRLKISNDKQYFKIISLVVDERYQRSGIAKNLFNYLLSYCKDNFFDGIIAITTSKQKSAIKFYESLTIFKLARSFKSDLKSLERIYIADIL